MLLHPRDPAELVRDWTATVHRWHIVDETIREAHVRDLGLISEVSDPQRAVLERIVDRGARGTSFARFERGRLVRAADLLTARDLTLLDSLRGCTLVFLSACEAGSTTLAGPVDEYAGLPAAMLLAGAQLVVAPMWPVTEPAAAPFTDCFYRQLAAREGQVDTAEINRKAAAELAHMPREEALHRIDALVPLLSADNALGKFLLESCRHTVAAGPPQPFADPYDWGAFGVVGNTEVNSNGGFEDDG